MRPSLLLAVLFLSSSGCSRQSDVPPPGILHPAPFARVYADLLGAGIPGEGAPSDSSARRSRIDSLLAAHDVSRAQFDSSVAWYNADVQRWREVMDSTTRLLESRIPGAY